MRHWPITFAQNGSGPFSCLPRYPQNGCLDRWRGVKNKVSRGKTEGCLSGKSTTKAVEVLKVLYCDFLSGKLIVVVVPLLIVLFIDSIALCKRAICQHTARPRPVPFAFVEKKGLNIFSIFFFSIPEPLSFIISFKYLPSCVPLICMVPFSDNAP